MITLENDELKAYIELCNEQLNPEAKLLYEASFLKIFVKFERYLSEMFELYCIGSQSSKGYIPRRKLEFQNAEHLRAVLRDGNKNYVDYIDKIQKVSGHIFIKNPFSVIFEEATNSTLFNKMVCMRNYIAHESPESRKKYIKNCLSGNSFIDVGDYLLKIDRRRSITNYSVYIEKIIEISELILYPPDI